MGAKAGGEAGKGAAQAAKRGPPVRRAVLVTVAVVEGVQDGEDGRQRTAGFSGGREGAVGLALVAKGGAGHSLAVL